MQHLLLKTLVDTSPFGPTLVFSKSFWKEAKLFYVFPHLLSNRCGGGRGWRSRRRRGVFVGPSDNLCTGSTAATWRWNVNTFWLSGSSHICLHPSTRPDPALHHPRFSFLSPLLSRRIPPNPNSWQNQMLLLRRLRRFICPRRGTAFAFLLAFFFFSVLFFLVSALIYYAAPLVFHFMEQRGCRPPPPTPLSATDRNGRTCRGKAAQLSSPASCVALKTKTWSRELEVVCEAVKSSACSLSLFPRSKRARPHCDGELVVDLWTRSESDVLFERVDGIKTSSRNLLFFRGSFFNQVSK